MSFLSPEQWEDYSRLKAIERAKELQECEEIETMEMLLEAKWYPTASEFRKFRELGQGMMTTDRWDRQGNMKEWNAK